MLEVLCPSVGCHLPCRHSNEVEQPGASVQRQTSEAALQSAQPVSRNDNAAANEAASGARDAAETHPEGEHEAEVVEASQAADLKVAVQQLGSSSDTGPEQPATPQQQQPAREKSKTIDDSHMVALMGMLPAFLCQLSLSFAHASGAFVLLALSVE